MTRALPRDSFGNLYLTYVGNVGGVHILLSIDGGQTFSLLRSFGGSVDQPTVVAENTTDPASPVAVWVVWSQNSFMRVSGAPVTGLGAANIGPFSATEKIVDTNSCSFGDVAIAPDGQVVPVCQVPVGGKFAGRIRVNIDPDGIGLRAPSARRSPLPRQTLEAWTISPPQNIKGVDAEAGLAYDRNPASPHFRQLYLVYTEEVTDEHDDTDIMVRYSDNNGQT